MAVSAREGFSSEGLSKPPPRAGTAGVTEGRARPTAEQVGLPGPQAHLTYSSSAVTTFDALKFRVRFNKSSTVEKASRNTVNPTVGGK